MVVIVNAAGAQAAQPPGFHLVAVTIRVSALHTVRRCLMLAMPHLAQPRLKKRCAKDF
jgi:hypothetical protein